MGTLGALDDDEMIDVGDDGPQAPALTGGVQFAKNGAAIIPDSDGCVTVDFDYHPDADQSLGDPKDHKANLAEFLDEGTLTTLALDMIEAFEDDEESRSEWKERLARGINMVGVAEEKGAGPFQGASRVIHPVLSEAMVQFQARAISELFPASGPAKAVILGEKTEAETQRAKRVEGYINWQYTEQMEEAFWENDSMLFRLPLDGSCFKKVYPDPMRGRPRAMFVSAEDLVVPYTANSLETASRYTHILRPMHNDLLKQMHSGFYRQVDLDEPDTLARDRVKEEIDETEGRSPSSVGIVHRMIDYQHTVLEMHCDYDLPGFEDVDEDGEPTGIALPYIITVEKDSKKVLAIRRNWRDPNQNNWPLAKPADQHQKRIYFVHYKFMPGLGFYGYGFLHTIGGLAKAATGALRQLLDAGKFASLQGGFKAKDAKMPGGTTTITPGQWVDVETAAEDLPKAFFRPPYAEPSPVLFQLLGFVVEAAQRFASTTEAMVGDASNTGPVGTTVALIEQGSKVFSAIHKRCHKAQGEELRMIAEIDFELMDENSEYPYTVDGQSQKVMRADFTDRINVVPVSDPNIFSSTQRIAQAQAVYQIATGDQSGAVDKRIALKRMFEALRIDNIPELLPDRNKVPHMDPISENMALLMGKPIRAFADQDHAAHIAVHMQWFQNLPPIGQKQLEGIALAHYAEHLAWQYQAQMAQSLAQQGIQLPPPPDFHDASGITKTVELPPQVENAIAAHAAMALQNMPPQPGSQGANGGPGSDQQDDAKTKVDQQKADQDGAAKTAAAQLAVQVEQNRMEVERARIDLEHTKAQLEHQRAADKLAHDRQIAEANLELKRVQLQIEQAKLALQQVKTGADIVAQGHAAHLGEQDMSHAEEAHRHAMEAGKQDMEQSAERHDAELDQMKAAAKQPEQGGNK